MGEGVAHFGQSRGNTYSVMAIKMKKSVRLVMLQVDTQKT